jgi:hypothetical protein
VVPAKSTPISLLPQTVADADAGGVSASDASASDVQSLLDALDANVNISSPPPPPPSSAVPAPVSLPVVPVVPDQPPPPPIVSQREIALFVTVAGAALLSRRVPLDAWFGGTIPFLPPRGSFMYAVVQCCFVAALVVVLQRVLHTNM